MVFIKLNLILVFAFFLLSFNGCSDNFEGLGSSCSYQIKKEQIDPQESSLIGNWIYEGFYKDGSFNSPPDDASATDGGKPYRLQYEETGELQIYAENSLNFESFQEYKSGAIRFQNFLGGSEMGPRYPWWEDHMIQALNKAQCYELDKNENKLHITSANEDGEKIIMKFRRI